VPDAPTVKLAEAPGETELLFGCSVIEGGTMSERMVRLTGADSIVPTELVTVTVYEPASVAFTLPMRSVGELAPEIGVVLSDHW
jgi:hypothetical protein